MNSTTKIAVFAAITASLLLPSATCRIVGADNTLTPSGPFTIRYIYTTGQVRHFSLMMDMNTVVSTPQSNNPMNIHLDSGVTQTIQSVRPTDGDGVQQTTIATNSALLNGQPLSPDVTAKFKTPDMTQVVTPEGQIVSTTVTGGQAANPNFIDPNSFGTVAFLPTAPVNIGDSWTSSFPLTKLGLTINCQMSLKSVEKIGGDNIAQIETKFTSSPTPPAAGGAPVPQFSAQLSGDALTNFDIDAGTLKSTIATMGTDITMPQAGGAATPSKPLYHMNMKMQMFQTP